MRLTDNLWDLLCSNSSVQISFRKMRISAVTMGVVTNQGLLWDGLYQMGMHFFQTFFILIVFCFMNDLKLTRITFWVRNSLVEKEHVVRFLKSSSLSGVNSVLYCEIFLKTGARKHEVFCVAVGLSYCNFSCSNW